MKYYSILINKKETLKFQLKIISKNGLVGGGIIRHGEYVDVKGKVHIKKGFRIECYPSFYESNYTPNFVIEDGVFIGFNFTALVADMLSIGSDTILASNVTLTTENHGMDPNSPIPYHAQKLTSGPISIGKGCWIGQNVIVLPNVRIGDKCIIAAQSVVNRDIPDYCIAAGCPAKIIKRYDFAECKWKR